MGISSGPIKSRGHAPRTPCFHLLLEKPLHVLHTDFQRQLSGSDLLPVSLSNQTCQSGQLRVHADKGQSSAYVH
jgi:hypothetical protein